MRGLDNKLSLAKAPAPKRGPGLTNKRDREVYDLCHQAWRAGLIDSWYFGRRAPNDPTIVWQLNGHEASREHVETAVSLRTEKAGILSLAWGATWCGYRELVVTYIDGSQLVQRYTGTGVEVAA